MAEKDTASDGLVGGPLGFIWGGNTGLSNEDLKRRRAIALALASRQRGFPKNVGEGLTYLGESIGEAFGDWRLRQMEAQQRSGDAAAFGDPAKASAPPPKASPKPAPAPRVVPVTPPAPSAPATAPAPVSSYAPPDEAVAEAPAAETAAAPIVVADNAPGSSSFASRYDDVYGGGGQPLPAPSFATRFDAVGGAAPQAPAAPAARPVQTETFRRPPEPIQPPEVHPGQAAVFQSEHAYTPPAEPFADRFGSAEQFAPSQQTAEMPMPRPRPDTMTAELPMPRPRPDVMTADLPMPRARPDGDLPAQAAMTPPGQPGNVQSWYDFSVRPREQGGLGLSHEQAAAKVANLQAESGPNIRPWGATGDGGTAFGAAQWRGPRFAALQQFAAERGLDHRTTEAQQAFMRHEYDTTERGAYQRLIGAKTPAEAATAINRYYERSADRTGGRESNAVRLANTLGPGGNYADPAVASAATARPPEAAAFGTEPDQRDLIAAALMQQSAQPQQQQAQAAPTEEDAAAEGRFNDAIGMRRPGSPFLARATASRGDIGSDAPMPGLSPLGSATGAGIADTVQQRQRIYDAVQQQGPATPPVDPTVTAATPPTSSPLISAAPTGSSVSDIQPMPPGIRPGDVTAQAWPTPLPGGGVALPPRDTSQGISRAIPPAPEPVAPRDPGPEPQPPGPNADMIRYRKIMMDPARGDEAKAMAQTLYAEEKSKQDGTYKRTWELWKHDREKKDTYDQGLPAARQSLTTSNLAIVKAQRELEGEGWVPLTPEKRAKLPPLPPGQFVYENNRGELKFSPTPLVTIDQRGENEFSKENAKNLAKMFGGMVDAGMTAADDLDAVSALRKSGVQTGGLAAMTGHLAQWGIKLPGASEVEFYNSMIDRLTPQQRVPGSGTTSDFDARSFKGSLPGLMKTPEGNAMIMDVMESIAENKMKRADVAMRVQINELTPQQGVLELRRLQTEAKAKSDAVKLFVSEQEKAASAPKTSPAPQTQQPTQQDNQAREWLKNNPDDPRAPAIRKRLGM